MVWLAWMVGRRNVLVNLHRFGASFLPQMDIWFGVLPIPCSFRGRVIEGRINIRLLRRSASLLFHHTFHPSFTKMNTVQPYDFAGLAFRKKKKQKLKSWDVPAFPSGYDIDVEASNQERYGSWFWFFQNEIARKACPGLSFRSQHSSPKSNTKWLLATGFL